MVKWSGVFKPGKWLLPTVILCPVPYPVPVEEQCAIPCCVRAAHDSFSKIPPVSTPAGPSSPLFSPGVVPTPALQKQIPNTEITGKTAQTLLRNGANWTLSLHFSNPSITCGRGVQCFTNGCRLREGKQDVLPTQISEQTLS